MKAIDILFDRIDELNSEIKLESDTRKKFIKALEIEQIVKVMREMEELRVGNITLLTSRQVSTMTTFSHVRP